MVAKKLLTALMGISAVVAASSATAANGFDTSWANYFPIVTECSLPTFDPAPGDWTMGETGIECFDSAAPSFEPEPRVMVVPEEPASPTVKG